MTDLISDSSCKYEYYYDFPMYSFFIVCSRSSNLIRVAIEVAVCTKVRYIVSSIPVLLLLLSVQTYFDIIIILLPDTFNLLNKTIAWFLNTREFCVKSYSSCTLK